MNFSPLGKFNSTAPTMPAVIATAKGLIARLPELPVGSIDHIYDHWTVGHLGQDFPDYNVSVRYDTTAEHFYLDITHDPSDNAWGVNNKPAAAHTWLRNEGAIGIATDDMVFATENDFGPEPLTLMALEFLCAANAAVAIKYSIDFSGLTTKAPYANEHPLETHGEVAMIGGNPPPLSWYDYGVTGTVERWDLGSFVPVPPGEKVTRGMVLDCADAIRVRSRIYKVAMMG